MKTLSNEIEVWQPPQSPLAIEYPRAVIDEVRDQVVAGYRRLSRGGVEVGGILYGAREEGKVRILATQPIVCEYKSGPSFILSEKDKHRLLDQLTSTGTAAEGLTVVGWYVSHPRGSVALAPGDAEIFNEFFPAIWNIALVLKPSEKSVLCGFFVREPRGSLNIAKSYQEFELALPRAAEGASAVRQIADQVSSSLSAQRSPVVDSLSQRRRGGGRRDIAEMPPPPRRLSATSSANGAAAAPALEAPFAHSHEAARPRSVMLATRRPEPSRRLKWRWLVLWAVAISFIALAAYGYREFTTPAPLGLKVAERDGELLIQWDPNANPLRWANAGQIEIQGAGRPKAKIDLSSSELLSGRYQYNSAEGDTSIHFAVTGRFGFHADESTRYVAQVAQIEQNSNKPVEIRDRKKLQAEVRRLREELEKSQARVKELESYLYNR